MGIWVRPNLTSATSYGTVSDSRNNTSERQEGWRCLDSDLDSIFSPAKEGGWWKWQLPINLFFVKNKSKIRIKLGYASADMLIRFYADEAMTKPLTDTITLEKQTSSYQEFSISQSEETNFIYMYIAAHSDWVAIADLTFTEVYDGDPFFVGSVTVSRGYYNSGRNEFNLLTDATKTLTQLKEQNPVGYKNNVLLTLDSEQVTDFILCGDGVQPEGSFVDTVTLPKNVYVNKGKEIILGTESQSGLETSLTSSAENFSVVGSLTSENGVFSGFSTSNYINFNNAGLVGVGSNTWEIKTKFKPMYSGSDEEEIIRAGTGIMIRTKSNAWKFILQNQSGSLFVSTTGGSFVTGTWYWLKASYDGTTYKLEVSTDGLVYDTVIQQASTDTAYSSGLFNYIGYDGGTLCMLNGSSIDLKETSIKIGDQMFWSAYTVGGTLITSSGYDYIDESLGYYELKSALEQSLDDLVPEVSDRAKTMGLYLVLTEQGNTEVRLSTAVPAGVSAYKKTYNVVLSDDLTTIESVEPIA